MICTWVGCQSSATQPQRDRQGRIWAQLCDSHHDMLEKAIADAFSGNKEVQAKGLKRMLSHWVSAQGGAKAMANK